MTSEQENIELEKTHDDNEEEEVKEDKPLTWKDLVSYHVEMITRLFTMKCILQFRVL